MIYSHNLVGYNVSIMKSKYGGCERRIPMKGFWKGFIVAMLIVYVISPVDLIPGPVDDIVLVFLSYVASRRKNLVEKSDDERIEVIDADGREL